VFIFKLEPGVDEIVWFAESWKGPGSRAREGHY